MKTHEKYRNTPDEIRVKSEGEQCFSCNLESAVPCFEGD